jgi:hypothetical protein
MLDNDEFDRLAEATGTKEALVRIYQLTDEPDNGVIATPRGRVFVEIKSFVIENTLILAMRRNMAVAAGDTKTVDQIDGRLQVLKQLLDVHDFMNTRAGIERAEDEANADRK